MCWEHKDKVSDLLREAVGRILGEIGAELGLA